MISPTDRPDYGHEEYRGTMRRKLRWILPFLIIAIGIVGGYRLLVERRDKPRTTIHLYGNVDLREVQLAFHATGRVRNVLVEEGAKVHAGQLIAELDPDRYSESVDRAVAQAGAQERVVAELLAGSRPEEIQAARARVQAAQASLADAEQIHRRAAALAKSQYVSRQKLETAEAALKSAQANLDAQRQALELALKGPRQETIDAARAKLKADQALHRLTERELADTRLCAPTAGVIQNRILEPGDMAFPQTPVVTLALNDPVWARVYVSEADLGKLFPGMRADVMTDSFPDKTYQGWVGFISPTAEFTPKQVETTELRSKLVYRVRVYVCNPNNELRLGMPVTVVIPLDQPRSPNAKGSDSPWRED